MSYSHIGGDSRTSFPELESLFQTIESIMGFLPNSLLIMSKKPKLMKAFQTLAGVVFSSKHLKPDLIQLIALASSLSSGCKYCQAHTSHGASVAGVTEEKINGILKYQESDYFNETEKAALDLAFASGATPNQTEKKHFEELEKYFSKEAIIDIVSVISLFGWLNRWNDTFGTTVEDVPKKFVEQKLSPLGWE